MVNSSLIEIADADKATPLTPLESVPTSSHTKMLSCTCSCQAVFCAASIRPGTTGGRHLDVRILRDQKPGSSLLRSRRTGV
jgi:hypothetical protein